MKPQQLKQLIREEVRKIAKSITKHNLNEGKYDADLDKIEAAVKNASSFMNVGAELKKAGIKYDFSTSMIPMYTVKVSGNTIAIVNKKYVDDAEREVNNIAIGLLEGVIKESTENFIGAALVKKSGMVKDLDSLEKEPIYVRDVLPIYRKEGSSYVVKSLMTGNALKVPAANLIVKMKDQFEPDKWAKFMAKMTRY
jgi:hypothetical protein